MIYGNIIQMTKEEIEYANIDYIDFVKGNLFKGLYKELHKNLKDTIKESKNEMTGNTEFEFRVVAFGVEEYSNMIKTLKQRISRLTTAEQTAIINLFTSDDVNRYHKENQKIYI